MHPVLIIVPAAALIFGPRLWVRYVLNQHNRTDDDVPMSAGELARQLLDQHELYRVKVEATDIGDHYDHRAKAVRLSRDKIDRKTLTAATAAAHEVAHAIQDASAYGPFVWRTRLVGVAQVAVEVGSVMLIAAPVTALATRRPVPPVVVGSAALSILGAGVATQLTALPTEFDASFGRAMPMLQDGVISADQVKDAKKILVACSLTYIASSLAAVLSLWPWLGRASAPPPRLYQSGLTSSGLMAGHTCNPRPAAVQHAPRQRRRNDPSRKSKQPGLVEDLVRQVGKPLIRGWFRPVYKV